MHPTNKTLVAKPRLAHEHDVSTRTIDRWTEDPTLNFPRPVKIKTRIYYYRDEVENWKADRLRKSLAERAPPPNRRSRLAQRVSKADGA